jgi:hypothetical protein
MYTIKRQATGSREAVVHIQDGQARPADPQDEYVQAFANAMVGPDHLAARSNPWLPPVDVLFQTRDELVRYCKDHVVKLVVRRDAAGGATLGHAISAATPQGTGRILNLQIAFAALPGSPEADRGDGIVGAESSLWVPEPLERLLAAELDDEASDVRRLTSWPIRRAFVFADISDFSKFRPGQQALMVMAVAGISRRHDFWTGDPAAERAIGDVEAMLCVGDGYVFVFRSCALATYFAAHLASLVEMLVARALVPVEIHFRMGVHADAVHCFWDPGRDDWNYIGDGINGGQRVLSVIGRDTDDVLFMSARVRQELLAASDEEETCRRILANSQNKGRRLDKHGNAWRVYEVNHTNLMSDRIRSLKEIASAT